MSKIKVAVLKGGESSEREISLISGQKVAENIPTEKYQVSTYDPKHDLLKLINDVNNKSIDVVFPVLHGNYGEDGTIQGLLELMHIPYVGCGILTSSLCMDKARTKEIVSYFKIKTPEFKLYNQKDNIDVDKIQLPCVVKPINSGSSVGISIPENIEELKKGIANAFLESNEIMIEKFIKGKEFTVGVLGNNELQALPPTEIIANISKFYDYKAKYEDGGSTHICPAKIDNKLTQKIQNTAKQIYNIVGSKGMSRIDFIWDEKNNDLYFIEVNTIPGMTNTSLLPEAAKAANIEFPALLDKLITFALEK